MGKKKVLLLKPRGFCAGVVRAIDIVKIALETFGAPIYVRREIVHNRYVVNELAEKGAIFVHEIDDVPDGQRVIYSAHGVSPAVRERSKARNLKVIDATCPLVTKVHFEAVKFAKEGYSLVLIGHRDHDEIEGTLGEAPDVTQVVSNVAEVEALKLPNPDRVAYLTQTTLSLDEARDIIHALKIKFPNIVGPHSQDICYATENRQVAVRNVAHNADLVLVVGSTNSSNSNRLVEVSRNLGTIGYLIDNSQAIDPKWLAGVTNVAVTAGASAPESWLKTWSVICARTALRTSKRLRLCRKMFASACLRRLCKPLAVRAAPSLCPFADRTIVDRTGSAFTSRAASECASRPEHDIVFQCSS